MVSMRFTFWWYLRYLMMILELTVLQRSCIFQNNKSILAKLMCKIGWKTRQYATNSTYIILLALKRILFWGWSDFHSLSQNTSLTFMKFVLNHIRYLNVMTLAGLRCTFLSVWCDIMIIQSIHYLIPDCTLSQMKQIHFQSVWFIQNMLIRYSSFIIPFDIM